LDHLKSPLNKKLIAKKRIPGWKPKQIKYKLPSEGSIQAKRRLKNLYQEKLTTKFKLFESPESITLINDKNLLMPINNAYQNDAKAFGYYDDELKVDVFHSMLVPDSMKEMKPVKIEGVVKMIDYIANDKARNALDMPGRIWLDQKYISFWKYPKSKEDFRRLIVNLEKKLDIQIWNDPNWKVEILHKDNKYYDPNDVEWDIKMLPIDITPMVIPIKEYDPHIKNIEYQLPGENEIKRHQELIKKHQKSWKN